MKKRGMPVRPLVTNKVGSYLFQHALPSMILILVGIQGYVQALVPGGIENLTIIPSMPVHGFGQEPESPDYFLSWTCARLFLVCDLQTSGAPDSFGLYGDRSDRLRSDI